MLKYHHDFIVGTNFLIEIFSLEFIKNHLKVLKLDAWS
jgi:hypothetical protein